MPPADTDQNPDDEPDKTATDLLELPIPERVEDAGLKALQKLAKGDRLRVNETEGTLTDFNPLDGNHRYLWARVIKAEENRYLLVVHPSKGTLLYEEHHRKWSSRTDVTSIAVLEFADVGLCEVNTVYTPTGGDHPADETHILRANDEEEVKQKLEGRTPPIEYYAAIYTGVGDGANVTDEIKDLAKQIE